MKFSSQEEYGLRFLIRIGKFYHVEKSFTIPEISIAEGVSEHTAAKILRQLRLGGFLESVRGQQGGYTLTRAPEKIIISDVIDILGGRLFDDEFCDSHGGENMICNNSIDCSVRSLWKAIQHSIDKVAKNLTLKDLLTTEINVNLKTSELN